MGEKNTPQIRCPNCGTTINLENRKNIDFNMILKALREKRRSFTDLLHITHLPRKTLSLRLKALIRSKAVLKNEGYSLNKSFSYDEWVNKIALNHSVNLKDTAFNLRKKLLMVLLVLIIGVPVAARVSAMIFGPPTHIPIPEPIASFNVSPQPPYYLNWMQLNTLNFDASSSKIHGGLTAEYKWDFGDGKRSRGNVVTHTYEAAGNFIVKLEIIDEEGKRDSVERQITILPTPTAMVNIVPQTISGISVGETFTIKIVASNVQNLWAWQTRMTFNPKVLQCITFDIIMPGPEEPVLATSALEEGPFLAEAGQTVFVAQTPPVDNYAGTIGYHGCSLLNSDKVTPVSGNGTLAYVTFKVIGNGTSEINLEDTVLLDSCIEKIVIISITNSYFWVP